MATDCAAIASQVTWRLGGPGGIATPRWPLLLCATYKEGRRQASIEKWPQPFLPFPATDMKTTDGLATVHRAAEAVQLGHCLPG